MAVMLYMADSVDGFLLTPQDLFPLFNVKSDCYALYFPWPSLARKLRFTYLAGPEPFRIFPTFRISRIDK